MRRIFLGIVATGVLIAATGAHAQSQSLADRMRQLLGQTGQASGNSASQSGGSAVAQLPHSEAVSGLKAALANSAGAAVTQLGQTDGFWGNPNLRIPLPGALNALAAPLKQAGYGSQMQNLQLSMNRAAEQATAQAGPIVRDAINQMTVADATQIVDGSDTAATDYLRSHTSDQLKTKFEPIIAQTTAQSQAASTFSTLLAQAKPMLSFIPGAANLNLNDYVTQQAMNGLFTVMGQQEQQIRENPAARTTDLLKQVFGAAAQQ